MPVYSKAAITSHPGGAWHLRQSSEAIGDVRELQAELRGELLSFFAIRLHVKASLEGVFRDLLKSVYGCVKLFYRGFYTGSTIVLQGSMCRDMRTVGV